MAHSFCCWRTTHMPAFYFEFFYRCSLLMLFLLSCFLWLLLFSMTLRTIQNSGTYIYTYTIELKQSTSIPAMFLLIFFFTFTLILISKCRTGDDNSSNSDGYVVVLLFSPVKSHKTATKFSFLVFCSPFFLLVGFFSSSRLFLLNTKKTAPWTWRRWRQYHSIVRIFL